MTSASSPTTTSIIAVPCGHDRHGNPLAARRYLVDARREDWGGGRTRVFEHRPDLEVGDGTLRFAPVVVRTDSIREYREPHPTERDLAAALGILREFQLSSLATPERKSPQSVIGMAKGGSVHQNEDHGSSCPVCFHAVHEGRCQDADDVGLPWDRPCDCDGPE